MLAETTTMIPPPEYFSHLFDYVIWADLRQLESTRSIPDAEYFKDRGWSFGSVHGILLHQLAAQRIWLDRFTGENPVWLCDNPAMSSRETIEPTWQAIHQRGTGFFASQTPQSLPAPVPGDRFSRPLWQLAIHLCNHSTHHRGQLNSMIKLAGGEPVETDYSIYVREARRTKPE